MDKLKSISDNGREGCRPLPKQHIGGNIVLLATETLEISNSEHDVINNNILSNSSSLGVTDEELTPLHWLHDKNLLKGTYLSERFFKFNHNICAIYLKHHFNRHKFVMQQKSILSK